MLSWPGAPAATRTGKVPARGWSGLHCYRGTQVISDWTRDIYLSELVYQAECAALAKRLLDNAIERKDMPSVFALAQNVMGNAAGMSKQLVACPGQLPT